MELATLLIADGCVRCNVPLRVAPPGTAPVSVAFLVRRATGAWQRLDVDTSPPYRGFLEPGRFKKNERVQVVAVARSLDGRTASSDIARFRMRSR